MINLETAENFDSGSFTPVEVLKYLEKLAKEMREVDIEEEKIMTATTIAINDKKFEESGVLVKKHEVIVQKRKELDEKYKKVKIIMAQFEPNPLKDNNQLNG